MRVQNPFNPNQISTYTLDVETVDCLVFWSKNPAPLLENMEELDSYAIPYYLLYTINPYGQAVEPNLPDQDRLIETFIRFSAAVGPHRVVWRYDPILWSRRFTPEFHLEAFTRLARRLEGYTDSCIVSFFSPYRKLKKNMELLGLTLPTFEQRFSLLKLLGGIAREHGCTLSVCADSSDYTEAGIGPAACIDAERIRTLTRRSISKKKDRSQRPACRCIQSTDIGSYNSCRCGCLYCYAGGNR